MRRKAAWFALCACAAAPPLAAQLHVGLTTSAVRLDEAAGAGTATGLGAGLAATWQRGRFGVRVDVAKAHLTPRDTSQAAYSQSRFEGRVSYRIKGALGAELGVERRSADPEFTTQDVGALMIGLRSDATLGQVGGVWARGSILPVVRFNGGGENATAIEVALGTWAVFAHGRFRAEADYRLQRIDRTVSGAALPLQQGFTRLGLLYRL